MTSFQTKTEMVNAWVKSRAHELSGKYENNIELAKIESKAIAVYVPHLYRGGFVIRGFGFSTERIGKYVSKELSGSPELV